MEEIHTWGGDMSEHTGKHLEDLNPTTGSGSTNNMVNALCANNHFCDCTTPC